MISFALKGIVLLGLASSASAYGVPGGFLNCFPEDLACGGGPNPALLLSQLSTDPATPYECLQELCVDNFVQLPFFTAAADLVENSNWSCGTCNDQYQVLSDLCNEADKCSSNVDVYGTFPSPVYGDFVGYTVHIIDLDGCTSFCLRADEVVPVLRANIPGQQQGCGPCPSSFVSGPCSICGDNREVTNPAGDFGAPGGVTCGDGETALLTVQFPDATCNEAQEFFFPLITNNCACADIENCGDNALTGDEDCDGNLFAGGVTCETYAGGGAFDGGTLNCINCQFDTSQCTLCGNGDTEDPEECDGGDLDGKTCASEGFTGGTLACNGDCTLDTSGCTTCGNAVLEAGEDCDGAVPGGVTCATIPGGFDGGTLACNGNCEYDTSGCTSSPTCGDGVLEAGEDCDGALLGGATCASEGFDVGTLACKGDCTFDTSACELLPVCGNNILEGTEECDKDKLGGKTCSDFEGFDGGTLACAADCKFDKSGCDEVITEECNGAFDNLNCLVKAIVAGIQAVLCVVTLGLLCP